MPHTRNTDRVIFEVTPKKGVIM